MFRMTQGQSNIIPHRFYFNRIILGRGRTVSGNIIAATQQFQKAKEIATSLIKKQ